MQGNEAAGAGETVAKKRRRSGSARREKSVRKIFRVSPKEDAELAAAADRAGVTFGTYARTHLLTTIQTGGRRKPSPEREALARLQGEVNRVGSNLHQLVKKVNYGDITEGAQVLALLRPMVADYDAVIGAIMQTLGREKAA